MKLRLFPINLALVGTIAFLGWDTVNTWRLSTDIPIEQSTSITIKTKEEIKEKKEKQKLLRHYAMIGKNNLFRPERKEWKPPPPPPPEPKPKEPPPPVEEPPPPPPPLPDPVLDGIIILSETNRIALMKGSSRESPSSTPSASAPKTRFRTRGRNRRSSRNISRPGRIITGEVKRYRLGDEISEMVIENILDDRVVLKRKNGEKVEVFLRSAEKTTQQIATSVKNTKKPPPTRRTDAKKTKTRRSNRFRRRSSRSPRRNAKDLLKAVEP